MDEVKEGLKYLFQTKNPVTFCASGSGSSAMETALGNLIEAGDVVLIAIIGTFGHRAADMAKRYGAVVRIVESKLGTALTYDQIRAHLESHKPKLLFIVHGDSSTGVLQSLDNLGDLCHRYVNTSFLLSHRTLYENPINSNVLVMNACWWWMR